MCATDSPGTQMAGQGGFRRRGLHRFTGSGDKALALERMRSHGIEIVSREMTVFEWLRRADTPLFKEISVEFLR